jgi:hypothetical protein
MYRRAMTDTPQNDEAQQFEVFGLDEYRFANNFNVAQPSAMVYVNLFQQDPHEAGRAQAVGRIVLLPDAARALGEELSKVRLLSELDPT